MNTLILGGTGFIGQGLVQALLDRGHQCLVPSRSPERYAVLGPGHRLVSWDGRSPESLRELVEQCDAVVNLIGESIGERRWNEPVRQRIRQSRVLAGEAVTSAFTQAASIPRVLVQASACGYYGGWTDRETAPVCYEDAPAGTTFLAEVCLAWETSTLPVEALGVRRCVIRTAPVLGDGGILKRFLPLARHHLGGPAGSGQQPFPWIHRQDEVHAILHLLEHPDLHGAFNLVSPLDASMQTFTEALGQALGKPWQIGAPAFAMQLLYGRMGEELILQGQRVSANRLLESGFSFMYPDLEMALWAILHP